VLVVVNIEGIRIIRNFLHTLLGAASGAVHFGWPVLWSPIQFVAHSFGMKSPFDSNVFWEDRLVSIWIFPILLFAIVVILVKIYRAKPKNLTILLLICINVIFWLAFLKFRYATAGLEGEIGNTFLQFKLAKWLAPFNLGLLGIAIAWLLVNGGKYKCIFKYTVVTAFVAGMAIQYVIVAQMFTLQFQDETMQKHSPFNVFLDLRSRVADIPKDQVIYLGIPTEHHKITQMVAYVLSDRKLAGKYEDGYLRGSIPEGERDMSLESADWMIQLKPTQTADENPLDRVGPFFIRRAPFSFYNLESVAGSYGTETGDKKIWNWVKDSVEYRFHHVGKTPRTKVKFQYLLAGKPRTLTLELNTSSGKRIASFEIPMKGGWGEYESPAIETNSEDIVVRLKADGEPVRLSEGDTRETKFLIQNLSLESSAQTPDKNIQNSVEQLSSNILDSITGSYDTETGDKKTWNWAKDSIEYRFHGTAKSHKSRVKFQFIPSGNPRTLFLELETLQGKRIASYKIPTKGGWGEYESPAVKIDSEVVVIRLSADGKPARISASDTRETKFLIQNLTFVNSL
jgi:hypothetical protein